ncbi:unnamed protein product [Mytilus coruscus]|uniref:RanBP2-type domain-containing protein n=1 Tax=Mytilus coruscus TaxID=42192 RepID=A0A6J8BEH9_MYTCO|nr:unnamed protein product [Mytilus coruscus]
MSPNDSVMKGKRPQSADRLAMDKGFKEPAKKNFLCVGPFDDKHRRPRSADNRLASRWSCCQCKYFNGEDKDVCEKCSHMTAPCCNAVTGKQWKCHVCNNLTSEAFTKCTNCSKKRKDPDLPKPATDFDHQEPVKNICLGAQHAVTGKHRRPQSADNRLASQWKCFQCKYFNGVEADVCEKCSHMKTPCCNAVKLWKCHLCEHFNSEAFTRCSYCSKKRKAPDLQMA